MAAPNQKLAESLSVLRQAQSGGKRVFQSKDFSRTHRERLVSSGFLKEVVKGWYILSRPNELDGDSTAWYASFFEFVVAYCSVRFGDDWHLSPEASLMRYAGNTTVPRQVLVHAKRGANNNLALKFDTSIFDYQIKEMPAPDDLVSQNGLRLLSLPAALVRISPTFFIGKSLDMHVVLSQVKDISEVLSKLLDGGHTVVAGRIAGAFRAIGRPDDADRIVRTMRLSDYAVTEQNPFDTPMATSGNSAEGPCSLRVRLMWEMMREQILTVFPKAPGLPVDIRPYIADINDRHVEDSYHSLSIEGYRVSEELIAKIASGVWNPAESETDKNDRNALAAKGYHQAFEQVRNSVTRILSKEEPGQVAKRDHHEWYMQLFGPSVKAGILEAKHLAGYRSWPVFIRNARHVPPSPESVRDAMPTLFDLLTNEQEPAVRGIMGHFIFVYIHPYMDGNGRMGRFMMNAMLASGGYPWTVIKVTDRNSYMLALEQASVHGNIIPFSEFVGNCVKQQMEKS
ncbi:Fic family protein [Propionivibrio sp.]|uniref:Fic family protein n=1 Tax=Propionivibrio sp. TaxID=2212460 RepID=UPI003BEFA409